MQISGEYITGFTEGEGCFVLSFRRDIRRERKNSPVYFYWDISFVLVLRIDDKSILQKINEYFKCGNITLAKKTSARYSITDMGQLSKIIVPFFHKYPLLGKKKFDFLLWEKALNIIIRNQQKSGDSIAGKSRVRLNKKDFNQLQKIYYRMRAYKAKNSNSKWLDEGYSKKYNGCV